MDKMATLLGGRAAEMLVFGELSTGASDDLTQVTNIARIMVMRHGMDAQLGMVTYERERELFLPEGESPEVFTRRFSEQTAWQIDEAVRGLVEVAYASATDILEGYRTELDQTAKLLLERESLTAGELPKLAPYRQPKNPLAAAT
jgi:cell division protease FtsH